MVGGISHRKIALILGGSSGLGFAAAQKLAQEGFDLVIVHRDRKSNMAQIEVTFSALKAYGGQCHTFNADATLPAKQEMLWESIRNTLGSRKISVLVHSIAKGNLKPMDGQNGLNSADFGLTLQAMAVSLYDWVRMIHKDQCFESDVRVIAFTSEGSSRAIAQYGAVSAAKAALESITRQIALEFAGYGIKANCIQAGITETKALQMIPNYKSLMAAAKKRNPNKRLTTPEDVANALYLLTLPEAQWITGTVIKVDGGESLQ